MSLPIVAVERSIKADAQTIFNVLADPAQHVTIDGATTVQDSWADNPKRLSKGATFGMGMKRGPAKYRITNRVVEFEEGRLIAWRHFAGHRWRYVLTPVAGGTLVREEWDASKLPVAKQVFMRLMRFPARNRAGMEATLVRLDQLVAQQRAEPSGHTCQPDRTGRE